MQINIILIEVYRSMNTKHMSIIAVAALAAMLVASTALATADNAFADKKKKSTHYEKSQATYQANDCGNGDNPIDIFCQNLDSQIQGDGNAVAIILEQR
jgi:uncharacterized membrane protein